MDTAPAAAAAAPRPAPDARGVISFSSGQVAVAQAGDTPASIAARLGLDAAALAAHNALPADAPLLAGAVLVLPTQVAAGAPAGAATGGGTAIVTDPFAGSAPASPTARRAAPAPAAAANPGEHVVAAGETAWAIARRYDVSVQDLASWNGLPADMSLQFRPASSGAAAAKARQAGHDRPRRGEPDPDPAIGHASPARRGDPTRGRPRPRHAPDRPGIHADRGIGRRASSMPVQGSIIRVHEREARTTGSTSRPRAARRSPRQAAAKWPRSPATARARRSSWSDTRAI